MPKRQERRVRSGKPFYVHVSPGQCPCCHWSATHVPFDMSHHGHYVRPDNTKPLYIGCEGSKFRFDYFFKHYGVKLKPGEQVKVRLVVVAAMKSERAGRKP